MKYFIIFSICIALGCPGSLYAQSIPSWKINDLTKYINHSDSVLVINFWATFCKPCVGEIPYYQTVADKYRNQKVSMLLVSLDMKEAYPTKIAAFAASHNFYHRIIWLNETNADYFCPKVDKKWSGAIPTTYFVNLKTGYRKLIEEPLSEKRFEEELKTALSQ